MIFADFSTNDMPHQKLNEIRTKIQMINIYNDKIGRLVTSGTKI